MSRLKKTCYIVISYAYQTLVSSYPL